MFGDIVSVTKISKLFKKLYRLIDIAHTIYNSHISTLMLPFCMVHLGEQKQCKRLSCKCYIIYSHAPCKTQECTILNIQYYYCTKKYHCASAKMEFLHMQGNTKPEKYVWKWKKYLHHNLTFWANIWVHHANIFNGTAQALFGTH